MQKAMDKLKKFEEQIRKDEEKPSFVSTINNMLKCERCGNYKAIGKRCKFCGASSASGGRQASEDFVGSAPARSSSGLNLLASSIKSCNTCAQWKHQSKDFLLNEKICNDCLKEPGFADDGSQLAGKWKPGPSFPTQLTRKPSGITKYKRPGNGSFNRRPSAVTCFGYEAWQQAVQLFLSFEQRWDLWGAKPITLHDLLSRKKSHALVRVQLSPPPLCDACSDNAAEYACPSGMLPIECVEQHFACHQCYEQGFNTHKGVLGGRDREYTLTILRSIFSQADMDQSGALDFLECIYFFYSMSTRITYLGQSKFSSVQQLKAAYDAYVDDMDGMTVATMGKMFKDAFRVIPTGLEAIFERLVGKDALADFPHTLWVMYNIARPDSAHMHRMDQAEKTQHRSEPPDIPFPDREPSDLVLPDVPNFVKSKCRILQMLGQGGLSLVWLIDYDGFKMAAKVPKAGIKTKHKRDMFNAARAQALIRHPNVLRVLGVHEECSWPCILLELAEAGDLTEWQVGKVDRRMQWKSLMEVAQGMHALHSCQPPLIHRDLKGQNVFLTKSGVAKVADFDFVTKAEPPHYTAKGICGTPGFMAPEMLAELAYGVKVDVFSYGSLLYEVTHKTFPFSKELEDRSSLTMEDWFEMAGSLTLEGVRPKLNERKSSARMRDLIARCWDGNPFERPSMAEVSAELQELREEFVHFVPPL